MFFLIPGTWLGEGQIFITGSKEPIPYYTKWVVGPQLDGCVHAVQVVEKEGVKEHIINHYRFSEISDEAFFVEMENNLLGIAKGAGVAEEERARWDFPPGATSHGFEEVRPIADSEYTVHAEFDSGEFVTRIEGTLWRAEE